ncbi:MAG: ABC transporter substrate-binding protein [Deltaproteobacteria bacterium]|nr:MAG: ABC transporter substrate-binding protein [Deltaproteobacteria bacterium]
MQHRRWIFTIVIFVLLLGAGPGVAQTLLRIATPGALTGALPIYLGAKKGVFSKYGLTVGVIATRNEQMNMQALMSDSVQFLTSSSTGLFYLGKQGLDAVGLASWNNSSPYSLATRLKIKDLKELKGWKIASSGAGGRADAFIRFMLAKVGLDHRTDAQIIPLSGGSSVRLAAVVSGNLDATLISTLQGRQAEKLGLTVIPVPLEYIWGINLTRRSYLSKNRDTVKNYLRGLSDSVRLMMADKAATIAVMRQVLKIDDADSLEDAYKTMSADSRPDLFPTEEAIVNVLRTMSYEDPAFMSIPPYKFFDLSLIQELKPELR